MILAKGIRQQCLMPFYYLKEEQKPDYTNFTYKKLKIEIIC